MNLVINGKKKELEEGTTVGRLLKIKKVRPEVVTVELNDQIIEREKYGDTILKEGDRLELVYYMGGGVGLV
ncbi:MAG: sulfur carrier protein ThiS [Nitrospirae bacterium]|nr:sulfur carrier protein ThiS [Nitrospirota bacterium]